MQQPRRKFVAGNWKMYNTLPEALALVTELKRLTAMVRQTDIAVIPPALFVDPVRRRLEGTNVEVGVQNILTTGFGARTGELSADMLAGLGVSCCIAGHSERRHYFGETDEIVNGKVKAILSVGITPILCIGETLQQREDKATFGVLEQQMSQDTDGLDEQQGACLVVAYEPVWAIGTGRTASAEQVSEVHGWLREWLSDRFGSAAANRIRIQYGGSVKPENAMELMNVPDVDGALVGGASLDATKFAQIVKACGPIGE